MRLYADQPSGTVPRARALRRDASAPERRLLRALREASPGLKWRHQAPVGPYYADLLCLSERLVVEVDGDTHATTVEYDTRRTQFIRQEGFALLRVTDADVMANLEGVLSQVALTLRQREAARRSERGQPSGTPSPSPRAAARLAPLPAGEGR